MSVPTMPIWRRIWTKSGLSRDLLIGMLKNALPSTAALWIIQSDALGQEYNTVAFLPIIMTILMTPHIPRVPFVRLLIYTLFLQGVVLGVTLLAGYCVIQARIHTTPIGGDLNGYNSSAAAVCGVWMIVLIWGLQVLRTYKPIWTKPVIAGSIYVVVAMMTTCRLPTMHAMVKLNVQMFEMFLLGYAFSLITNLFIFPVSSRSVTTKDVATMFRLARQTLSPERPFGNIVISEETPFSAAHAQLIALNRAFAKFQIDVTDAKKDIGWTRISSRDYQDFTHLFRNLIVCMRGLFAVESIRTTLHFGSYADRFDKDNALEEPTDVDGKEHWDAVFEKLQQPVAQLCRLSDDAIEHCCLLMHLSKPCTVRRSGSVGDSSDQTDDSESEKTSQTLPGGTGFVEHFRRRIQEQRHTLRMVLAYLQDHDGPLGSTEHVDREKPAHKAHTPNAPQGRLLFKLYIEYLYHGILEALLELVLFCETRYRNSKPGLQVPGKKTLFKLIHSVTDHHHPEGDPDDITSDIPSHRVQVSQKLESEQANGRSVVARYRQTILYLERCYGVIGSSQSFFAIRVSCAIMSVAIVAYLHQTQQWFFDRRGLWAGLFIPFCMAPSSGESKAMLLHRVAGTAISIPTALVNWYIVDGQPAGVIVIFLVIAFVIQFWMIQYPFWGTFWRPFIITHSVIVGYSLQSLVATTPQPPATTTYDFPIYLIAPYRALCTLIGVGIAYIWTTFPLTMPANEVMRRRLGQALFVLSEYHNCMHWAISSWAGGQAGDVKEKGSVAYQLLKTKQRLFVRETSLLTVIRTQHDFAQWDFSLRGARPEHHYVKIANEVDRIMAYFNVVIFVATQFSTHVKNAPAPPTGPWESGIYDLLDVAKGTSRHIASLIHILASSVSNNQALPPFLIAPEAFAVARNLRAVRPELMDIQHAGEEGYKAFAVIEVSVAMISKSLDRILVLTREMVGEIGMEAACALPVAHQDFHD